MGKCDGSSDNLRLNLTTFFQILLFTMSTLAEERSDRLRIFRELFLGNQLDMCVVLNMENIFYLTGFQTPGAPPVQALIVTPTKAAMITRQLEVSNAEIHAVLLKDSSGYSEHDDALAHLSDQIMKDSPTRIGIEENSHRMSYQNVVRLKSLCNPIEFMDISRWICMQRRSKSSRELAAHRRAGEIACAGMWAAVASAKQPGATEATIAGSVHQAMHGQGHEHAAYPVFCCAGENGRLGHYPGKRSSLRPDAGLFMEIGGCFDRYHSALMRTIWIGETVPSEMKAAEKQVVLAIEAMRAAVRPGMTGGELDAVARRHLQKNGWSGSERSGYSIGIGFPSDWGEAHIIGIHKDSPMLIPLGATLHLIPWMRHPQFGAVGLSDTIVVTPDGGTSLLPQTKPPECILLVSPMRPHAEKASEIRDFMSLKPTPLREVGLTGGSCGRIYIKDESQRLGQKSFKALGSGFAMATLLQRHYGAIGKKFKDMQTSAQQTFTTASDGNHGAGVAWAAQSLGQKAVIFLPKGTSNSRQAAIRDLGAEVRITSFGYDETVSLARDTAKEEDWVLLQDTAWEGYTEPPSLIMDGYRAIAYEAIEQLEVPPTHVLLQVGVGSFAAAIVQCLVEAFGDTVKIISMEPTKSSCLFTSLQAGVSTFVSTLPTSMVGLDCGEVSTLAWPTLRDHCFAALRCGEGTAQAGVQLLAACGLLSGESGAIGAGVLYHAESNPQFAHTLGLGPESRVLLFNTEGITNQECTDAFLSSAMPSCVDIETFVVSA